VRLLEVQHCAAFFTVTAPVGRIDADQRRGRRPPQVSVCSAPWCAGISGNHGSLTRPAVAFSFTKPWW
jgi:hypothetical protein